MNLTREIFLNTMQLLKYMKYEYHGEYFNHLLDIHEKIQTWYKENNVQDLTTEEKEYLGKFNPVIHVPDVHDEPEKASVRFLHLRDYFTGKEAVKAIRLVREKFHWIDDLKILDPGAPIIQVNGQFWRPELPFLFFIDFQNSVLTFTTAEENGKQLVEKLYFLSSGEV